MDVILYVTGFIEKKTQKNVLNTYFTKLQTTINYKMTSTNNHVPLNLL